MTQQIPRTPFLLGVGGLVPFVVLAVMLWALPSGYAPTAVRWLLCYGAVILTFVGALHWGVALVHPEMDDRQRALLMAWSVVPALVAWFALLVDPLAGVVILLLMFIVQLVADHRLVQHVAVTPWFLRLRQRLTFAVVSCLALAALFLFVR